MSNFVPENVFLQGVLFHYFNMKKIAAESHRILVEVYSQHALAERTCQKLFARFKSGDFGLEDEERPEQPKKIEDEELEALLDEDCFQTQEEHNALTGIRLTSEQGIKNWLDSFLAAKPAQFFRDGIHKLPERWEKVIASDGQYFE